MNKFQLRVGKAVYKPNCYILVSATRKSGELYRDVYYAEPTMSFFYDAGDVAAEWEPRYGPIQVWSKCDETYDGKYKAREHYFYDFVIDIPGNWSQLSVETERLPQAFVRGDYDHIFSVLKSWARR